MRRLAVLLLIGGCAGGPDGSAGTAATGGTAGTEGHRDPMAVGTAVYVGDEEVRGYRPQPMLVVPATAVPRSRFPAVDVHCHWSLEQDPRAMLAAMDEHNLRCAVNLSGGFGAELDAMLMKFAAAAPQRLLIFCNLDFSGIDEASFGAEAEAFLEDARRRGVAGLKVFKDLGLSLRDRTGRLVAIDDPRLDPVWRKCGALGMPVLMHTADPAAFFEPVDRFNERWMQLRRHSDWSYHGLGLPSRAELFAQRNRVLKRHPGTIFIGAHMAGNAEDLAAAARALDEHPNLYVDISGRVAELGRQPYTARQFFLKYQDRILFGTDRYPGRPDQPRYRVYFRFLETADEYFDYHEHDFPPTGEWKIYGIDLPEEVLRKVYHENAERVLGGG